MFILIEEIPVFFILTNIVLYKYFLFMKRTFVKIIVLIELVIMLPYLGGFALDHHFMGGKYIGTSLFSKTDNCCSGSVCTCCDIKKTEFKILDSYLLSFNDLTLNIDNIFIHEQLVEEFFRFTGISEKLSPRAPPDIVKSGRNILQSSKRLRI
ncbi:MAG: hypothetical protein JXR48_09825 [Candidatus Delongbacteria bacterium]|nr:hypothetical protein [Candidatus Delongbacteria bacterium]MBN2835252.1 hypothetical protein [Candidatus Delongbacteria bacterium]